MLKKIFEKYKYVILLLYFPFYMAAFTWLERNPTEKVHIISSQLDKYIPFCEAFVIPYLLWFAFMGIFGIYFFFREKEMFCKMMYVGMFGMTIFLIVSFVFPNGLELRPTEFVRDNILVELTKMVYRIDTARNVAPSIHVFNTVGICYCILKSSTLKSKKWITWSSVVLSVLIVLSTMFLKQHSVWDVVLALVLDYIAIDIVFNHRLEYALEKWRGQRFQVKRRKLSIRE